MDYRNVVAQVYEGTDRWQAESNSGAIYSKIKAG